MSQNRRTFLKTTGAALSVAAMGACEPEGGPTPGVATPRLDPTLLRAVADLVLPSELGDAGRGAAVQDFRRWALGYDPVPELNHGYGTSEIRYGPADPVPAWGAQLTALELEAGKRHGMGFAALDPSARNALLRRHIGSPGAGMPSPLGARHVAVALMAHWFDSPAATDRCYGVRITPQSCRGLDGSPLEPEALA